VFPTVPELLPFATPLLLPVAPLLDPELLPVAPLLDPELLPAVPLLLPETAPELLPIPASSLTSGVLEDEHARATIAAAVIVPVTKLIVVRILVSPTSS